MSTDRDELIELVWDGAVADRVKAGKDPRQVPVVRPKVEALADAILAAGYRKSRTLQSLAELVALAAESAVQTSDTSDTVVLKGGDGLFVNAFGGEVDAETLWRYGNKPFTVIYEPEAP